MKLQKCWLSAGLTAALLASLILNVHTNQDNESNDLDVASQPKLDASVFADKAVKPEKHQFGAEVSRLLNMITNSLYTDNTAVVRELLSNAVDAIEKQYDTQLVKAGSGGDMDDIANYKVVVEVDKDAGILSITDNGIGMTHDELKTFLGTIAKSGTAEFASAKNKKTDKSEVMIGQFGVGFYSSLLIAEKVAVVSKNDNDPKQWIWETDATASFHISEDPNGNTLKRGTRVMLKLKPTASEFLDHEKLEKMMKEYFGHKRHRIYLVKPKTVTEEVPDEDAEEAKKEGEEEKKEDDVEVAEEKKDTKPKTKKVEKTIWENVLVSQGVKPAWTRSPAEVKPEEYQALYKKISGDKNGKYMAYTHFAGETALSESFSAILYIPERPPFSPFSQKDQELDIKLHVRGVFVTAKLQDFIPKYLSFVKGVINSDDLSLNISREILQNTSELRGVRKMVLKKTIGMMNDLAEDKDKYKKFYEAYSSFIKMEISENEDNRSLLSKLLRYRTTKSGEQMRSLDEYIESISEAQKTKKVIYYLAGKADEVAKSPFLGRFADKGIEVVLMTDPVDEHTIERMTKYEDFKFENIAKDGIKLDDEDDKEIKEYEEKYKTAKTWLDKALKDSIEKVVFVPGPVNVPGSFKSSQFGWTGNMERLIMAQSSVQEDPMLSFFSKQKKILELNPKNPLVHEILERANSGKATKELKTILRTFTDSMMIWSGYSIRDPAVFAKGIDRLMNQALGLTVEPIASEPEEKEESDAEEDLSLSSMDLDKEEKKSEIEKDESKKSEKEPKKDESKKSEEEPKKDKEQDKDEL